jgi:methylated-DNA-[protein]-cysteine S-methyltransferase
VTLTSWTMQTPSAPLAVVADGDEVVASGFTEPGVLIERLGVDPITVESQSVIAIENAVVAYLNGDLTALDTVSVAQRGGEFSQEVWDRLRDIPPGQTWSYTELATKAGRPSAVRAAASGCARNLVAPFVPCHRVVRSDGTLGGYAYGLEVKRWLLAHETAH